MQNADFNTWRRERNLKSHATRSKLLSLHLVLTILNSYVAPFVDSKAIIYSSSTNEATTFVQAVNQYLHFSLSRNAVNPVPQVFEVSMEIFWQVLSGMRTKLKVLPLSMNCTQLICCCTERDRSSTARDIHSYPGNEDFNSQAEGCNHWNALQTSSGPAGFGRDISRL
jgi:Sec7-like guanine-nucleotide exchange factor